MDGSLTQFGHFVDNNSLWIIALFSMVLGFGIAWLLYSGPLARAHQEIVRLRLHIQSEQRIYQERLKSMEQAREQMTDTFTALSQHALRDNNEHFLQLAQESMSRFHNFAQSDLDHRKEAIENLIQPVQTVLDKTRDQVLQIEKERQHSFGSLSEQLKSLGEDQLNLRQETNNLVTALRRPEVRGQWGEISLKRLVELSGMTQYADFIEQVHRQQGDTVIRPDMMIKMPDNRELIIDAKTPLDAYLAAVSTDDIDVAKLQFQRHARIVRQHMKELASKRYWEQFDNSPDFVVLFVPGEQFLGVALEYDQSLLQDALSERVILASPTSLIALLRAVAFGWKQVCLSENAEKIRDLGEEVYKRVATFTEHMARLGKSLDNSVDHYNKALGSLERTVLPGVRKFSELGLQDKKSIPDTEIIEKVPRQPIETDKNPKG